MKVLITGSREWTSHSIIRRELAPLPPRTIIVHGGNGYFDNAGRGFSGADMLADEAARCLGFSVRVYRADWKGLGPSAGPIRNAEMLARENPDAAGIPIHLVIAFSKSFTRAFSPGTVGMIQLAERVGLTVRKVSE